MGFRAGEAIESASVFKTNRRASGAGEVDGFLEAVTAGTARDKDALQRAFGAQGFDNGMDSDENGQLTIMARGKRARAVPAVSVRAEYRGCY